jgi:putative copper resistance protein D
MGAAELRALRVAAALALASGVLWPWLQTGVVTDEVSAALDPQQVAQVLTQTSFGRTWLIRQAFVVLALLGAVVPGLATGRVVYFLVAAALASMALIGHAASASGAYGTFERVTLALHLLAAGAWLGALPLLWVLAGRLPPIDLAQILRRFSSYGITLVMIVALTGVLSAWVRIGALQAVVASNYGRILLGKVALVLLMGAVALNNRNRLTPALERSSTADPDPVRARLRGSIATETGLGILVVAVAIVLGSSEAPR